MGMPLSRRQKSWDILDQSAIAFARQHKVPAHQVRLLLFNFKVICSRKYRRQVESSFMIFFLLV